MQPARALLEPAPVGPEQRVPGLPEPQGAQEPLVASLERPVRHCPGGRGQLERWHPGRGCFGLARPGRELPGWRPFELLEALWFRRTLRPADERQARRVQLALQEVRRRPPAGKRWEQGRAVYRNRNDRRIPAPLQTRAPAAARETPERPPRRVLLVPREVAAQQAAAQPQPIVAWRAQIPLGDLLCRAVWRGLVQGPPARAVYRSRNDRRTPAVLQFLLLVPARRIAGQCFRRPEPDPVLAALVRPAFVRRRLRELALPGPRRLARGEGQSG